ncbi:MAG: hypothetical protein K6C08_01365 [Oscillospiraceae bacterium]|nr:hypothetical protein [Oscillospiraceae bacterium]
MKYLLGGLAEITVGQIMSRVAAKDRVYTPADARPVKVVIPKAIGYGIIDNENLGDAMLIRDVADSRVTRAGDIVIKLSSPYESGLVQEGQEGMIVPSFCAIIRMADEKAVDRKYLLGFLNSSYAQSILTAGVDASAMAMIKIKSLVDLAVPCPSMEGQKLTGKAYWASCMKRAALEKLMKQQHVISQGIISSTIKEVI